MQLIRGDVGRARSAIGGVLVLLVLLLLVYVVAVLTVPGQWLDDEIFGLVQRLGVGPLAQWLPIVSRVLLPRLVVGCVILLALVALARRQWAGPAEALILLSGTVVTSRLLREWLPRPDHGYSYVENTLPSTHMTVVAAAAVAIVLLWPTSPPGWLTPVLVGVLVVAAVGNVVGHAHRPSDVLASLLLVAAATSMVRVVTRSPTREAKPLA